jgi:hypothetical protein
MVGQDLLERVETTQNTWVFDRLRRRFSRVPREQDPDDPAVPTEWQRYYSVSFDEDGTGFTIALDALGTRLLRAGFAD